MGNQAVTQAQLVDQAAMSAGKATMQLALFDQDGAQIVPTGLLQTGEDIVLTGYTSGSPASVNSTDTVNAAIAKVAANAAVHDTGAQVVLTGYSSGSPGAPASTDTVNAAIAKVAANAAVHDTGANVLMTDFTTHAVGDVLATDTLNVAVGKLMARIAALETP